MPSNLAYDNVISLASARSRRDGGREGDARLRAPMRTVIIQVRNIQAAREVHRQIGIDASMHLADVHRVLGIVFGLEESSPWHFADAVSRLEPDVMIDTVLREEGDALLYTWGLWHFTLRCVGVFPRDNGTPRALCIGGSGDLHGADFDQAAANAALTGTDTIREVLDSARPEIRCLVSRSGVFDFVPLLQALDLSRARTLSSTVSAQLRALPLEKSDLGSDAFWSCVLALACLGDDTLVDDVATTTVAALGWLDNDGAELSLSAVTAECAQSLAVLETLGAYGDMLVSPVERLEIFRELLRA